MSSFIIIVAPFRCSSWFHTTILMRIVVFPNLLFLCTSRSAYSVFTSPFFSIALLPSGCPPHHLLLLPLLLPSSSSPTLWLMSSKYPSIAPISHINLPRLCPFASFGFTHPLPFKCAPSLTHTQKNVSPSLLPAGLIISLQLLRGELEQIRRENQAVFNRALALTRKLGFPDVILPGEEAKSAGR